MAPRTRRGRRAVSRGVDVNLRKTLIWTVLAVSTTALWPATGASAHASLESSTPSPSAVLETSPQDIGLEFSEPVSLGEGSVVLYDQRRQRVSIPTARVMDSARVEVAELPDLPAGMYLVTWRVLSQDGHVAQGAFTFQIGTQFPGVAAQDLLAGVDSSTTGPAGLSIVRATARVAIYLGLSAVLGTLALVVWIGMRRVRRIIALGWVAATIGSLVQFMAQGVYVTGGSWSDLVDPGTWREVSTTRLGIGLLIRIGLLVIVAMLIVQAGRARSSVETTWWRSTTFLVGGGIIATFAATGHPSSSTPAAVAAGIDALHLSSVLIWAGGLLGLLFGSSPPQVVQKFSRIATWALPTAVVTGVWQAWHLIDDLSDVGANDWGRALLVKTSVVVVAATLGMVARWMVLANHQVSVRRLVAAEVIGATLILSATSVLVASPPRTTPEASVVSVTMAQGDVIADVTVTPGRVGRNDIHVTMSTPKGVLRPVEGIDMRMTLDRSDVPPIAVEVEELGPNHFLGTVSILDSGTWTLEVLARVSSSEIVRLSTTIKI